ncbi:PadR family transcriptional regulator [Microtetraspora malaysiensis]|uniref:PadR family transcriptional regulator n=1 Tax=Microtetraspora malaysiensis TaxID=161358 RepID=UPI003D8DDFC7
MWEPKNLLSPCLLLLLGERPDHGYELVRRLRPLGIVDGDTSTVYRTLRSLERHGCLCSDWAPSGTGPARRVYRITAKGRTELLSWLGTLEETRRRLDYYMRRLAPLIENRHAHPDGA